MDTFQTRYGKRLKPTIDTGEGLTEQAHKDECCINRILADYTRTGLLKHAKQFEGRYDDVSAMDFQEAMNTVANVKTLFEALPSKTRYEFGNDPVHFLSYVQNPANSQRLQEMGILRGNDGLKFDGKPSGAPVKTPSVKPEENTAPVENGAE